MVLLRCTLPSHSGSYYAGVRHLNDSSHAQPNHNMSRDKVFKYVALRYKMLYSMGPVMVICTMPIMSFKSDFVHLLLLVYWLPIIRFVQLFWNRMKKYIKSFKIFMIGFQKLLFKYTKNKL